MFASLIESGCTNAKHGNKFVSVIKCFLGVFQARDFYVEMKWEFTSWGESIS